MLDFITKAMALYGWGALWYANPFEKGAVLTETVTLEEQWVEKFGEPSTLLGEIKDRPAVLHFGPRWHVGVWTGPQLDLVCLKGCETNEEANVWLSPGGWTPEDAVQKAIEKLRELEG